jgi:hypothetical protein
LHHRGIGARLVDIDPVVRALRADPIKRPLGHRFGGVPGVRSFTWRDDLIRARSQPPLVVRIWVNVSAVLASSAGAVSVAHSPASP